LIINDLDNFNKLQLNMSTYEDKVIHCKNENETMTIIQMLESQGYEYAIPFKSLNEFAESFAEDNGWEGCWRICQTRGIAYNQDVNHWIENGYEIIEYEDLWQ